MENLPLLLDIPILKAHEVALAWPDGTGPYYKTQGLSGHRLTRRTDWWCKADMTITAPVIQLIEAENLYQIRDEFQFGELDLVQADPGSDNYADYRSDYELWDSENGIFLFLVCNREKSVFSSAQARAALTYGIDRDTLAKEYYRGFARSATLPASPLSPYYNSMLADKYGYNDLAFAQAVNSAGMRDKPIVLLVNSDDSLRLRVARLIAESLRNCGLTVQMKELSTESYRYALSRKEYDIYLGQTKLSNNMDLTAFFSSNGELSYGGIDDVALYTLCMEALANHGNFYTLAQSVMNDGRLCPVLFRSYAIYARRGLLTGLTPARDNVFYYSLGKSMENVRG